LTEVEL